MKDFFNAWQKPIEVAFLLLVLLALDLLKVDDPGLKFLLIGLVGLVTGHGTTAQAAPPANTPAVQ